jgi:C-terminal processing protease CtpA/Prc
MVVPGGPAYVKQGRLQGQRIDKGDQIVKIDGKEATSGNLIPLLRGRDVVGSPVTVEIQKESEQEPRTFTLHRADIRHKSSFAA